MPDVPERLTTRLAALLGSRQATAVVLVVAILARVIQVVFFYNIRVDASFQVMATQHFVQGHGFSTAAVRAADLADPLYTPLTNWPPGYSFLLAPFYLLTQPNYMLGGILLDVAGALLLLFSGRAVLRTLDVSLPVINLFTLLTCFYIYYFYFIASSDSVAIAIFCFGLLYFLKLLKGETGTRKVVVFTLCLLFCGWMKYLLIPVLFVLPLFLLAKGLAQRNQRLKQAGVISFSVLLVGIGALLFYNQQMSGSAAYISQPERGFFPGHLKEAYPFVPAAFIKPDTFSLLFPESRGLHAGLQVLHLLLLVVIGLWLAMRLGMKGLSKLTVSESFFVTGYLVSLGITLLLAILSVRVAKEEILPGWFWTYVEEPRYYGLCAVWIHLCLFLLVAMQVRKPAMNRRWLPVLLIMALVPEAARGLVLTANRLRLLRKEEYSWQWEHRFEKEAARVIAAERRSSEKLAVGGSWYYMNHRVALYSRAPLLPDVETVSTPAALKASSPTLLLLILRTQDLDRFRPFLADPAVKEGGRFENYHFYTLHVGDR